MQKMKKFMSVVLTLAMLMSMIVLPAAAEALTETITPGETKNIDLPAESALHLLFTPAESGYYIFYTSMDTPFDWWAYYEGTEAEGEYRLFPEQWFEPTYTYRGEVIPAEAGKTYLLEVENFQTEPISGFFTLVKAQNYETFELDRETYAGYADTTLSLILTTGPDYAYEAVTWTSSNPQVADLGSRYSNGIEIILSTPGTAVITASTDCGNSASCTVTVKEPETITVGETKNFTLGEYEEARFLFTPTESGRYILYIPRGGSCYHSVYEGTQIDDYGSSQLSGVSWSDPENKYYGFAVDLTAGKTYTILLRESYGNDDQSGTLTLLKAAPYESIEIQELYQPKVGDQLPLYADTAPATASENITWTSSNPDIAEIYVQDFYVGAILKAPGTVTITATADSGTSDSYTFTVEGVRTLQVGDTVDVTIEPNTYAYFNFTPAESGRYIIYAPADDYIGSNAEDENYNRVYEEEWISADGAYRGNSYAFAGGVSHRINVYLPGSREEAVSTQVTMVKAAEFDSFALSRQTMNCFVGDYDTLSIVVTPDFASEDVTWESSDPSVVSIVGGYAGYTYLDSVGAGTATITARTSTGKVATCVVTVNEPVQMEKNTEYTGTVDVDKYIPCYFTAPEDGTYTFASLGDGNYYVTTWDLEGNYVAPTNVIHKRGVRCELYEMKAGETYHYRLHNQNDFETEFRFMIGKDVPATGMTLPIVEEEVYTNTSFRMYPFFEPILAMEERVTWASSDPEVVQHTDTQSVEYQPGYVYDEYFFEAKKPGTVTLTATSESGFQASCVIHVVERKEIGLGKHSTKPLHAEHDVMGFYQVDEFVFCPETTGEYNLYWEKDSIDESTFFYWNGYYSVLEGIAWENEYYCGIRVELNGLDVLEEPQKELEELEKVWEEMEEGLEKDQKKQELEIKKWEFQELSRSVYTSIAVHNATSEPQQITFYLEAYTGKDPIIHTHAPKLVGEKKATFAEDGYKAHYACECGALFADEAGTTEVTAADLLIPKLIQVEEGKAEVPKEAIDEAIKEVEQGGEVSIPVADAGANSEEEVKSAALPVESLTQITEKEATLTVEMPAASVTMDTAALAAVVEKAGENASVTLEVQEVAKEDLTESQVAAIEELDKNLVTTISAELLVNDQAIASEADGGFGGGKVTVKIAIKLSGEFDVLYIADDGTVTKIENATYENGILTLELEHFSDYAIVQDTLLGDVNGDGSVTVLDLMRLANFFAGKDVEINEGNANVNGDDKVTVLDLMRLANFFAGKAELG